MIHSFYFRFFKLTHCKWLSIVLSKLAYRCFSLKFRLLKILQKKRIVSGNAESTKEKIRSVYEKKAIPQEIINVPADASMDLSIIVPVYNYAALIKDNIDSILHQKTDYKFELIIVDDGSTDGAQDIVKEYISKPNVKVIFQENTGIAGARNTGLNHACGRYIMFVDCDDIVTEDLVDTLMSKALEENADIVMCAHDLVKQKGGIITSVIPNIYSGKNLFGYSKQASILNYAGLPWCKVYKRELWEDVRFFRGFWYEDTIIHALIFTQCKKFCYVPKSCYKYRWYENNFSHVQGNHADVRCLDYYYLLQEILHKADELGITSSDCFYTMLLKHLCDYFYKKVQGMDDEVLQELFIMCRDILNRYRPDHKVKLPYVLRAAEKALIVGDINLWMLASNYC